MSYLNPGDKLTLPLNVTWPNTRGQILNSSKLKDSGDDNVKFEENGRKLFKPVENNVGKWKIAYFPTVFSKGLFPRGVKRCHCVGMG